MNQDPVPVFCVPKSDWDLEHCQDRWQARATRDGFRAALSDGATEACLSRLWADQLAQAGVAGLPILSAWGRPAWDPRMRGLALAWRQAAEDALPEPRPWFAAQALHRGSHATLLQVWLKGNRWEARAVGDTCLLVLRGRSLRSSFPIREASAFGSSPALLTTLDGVPPRNGVRRAVGHLRPGDAMLLATDALACRLLAMDGAADLVEDLAGPDAQVRFQAWVEAERAAGRMRNDDTTLLLYRYPK